MKFSSLLFNLLCLVLFSLLFNSPEIMAQEQPATKLVYPKKYILKTAPIHFDEINVALEYHYKEERSYQFGFGYLHSTQVDEGYFVVPFKREVSGFAIKLSQRTFNVDGVFTPPQGHYRGPLLTYRFLAFPEKYNSYYQAGNLVTTNNYQLFQQVLSLQYLWGIQRIAWNWLVFDGYFGLGGRVKYAREERGHPDNDILGGILYGTRLFNGPDWVVKFGPSVSLNLAIGVVLK